MMILRAGREVNPQSKAAEFSVKSTICTSSSQDLETNVTEKKRALGILFSWAKITLKHSYPYIFRLSVSVEFQELRAVVVGYEWM